MQTKQANGLDTRMMTPVYSGLFCILCQWFRPWISIPALRLSRLPAGYSVFQTNACLRNFQASLVGGGKIGAEPLTDAEMAMLSPWISGLKVGVLLMTVLLVLCAAAVVVYRTKSKPLVYGVFSLQLGLLFYQAGLLTAANLWLNHRMGRPVNFQTLTIRSYMQLTSWVYAQMLVCILQMAFANQFLTIPQEKPMKYVQRTAKQDNRVGKRTLTAMLLILLAMPLVIFFGIYFLNDRSAVFIGVCMICLAMLPFAMVFEDRRPQARELLLIAVLSGLAVVGRMAFFMVPGFKPVTAIVIIAGIGLGAEAGFLTGAVSGFVSNFFFGQGPWTPWQMFCFGLIGFLAGLIFHRNRWLARQKEGVIRFWECAFGAVTTMGIYGVIMDFSTIVTFSSGFSWELFGARLLSGVPYNLVHAASTVVFLLFLARPMEQKLDRIKKKYGILEV